MIRKIKNNEYLKGYDAMSDEERKDYQSRVEGWLADGGRRLLEITDRPMAKAQNIVLLTMRWKEPEVRMFTDGVSLMSALVNVADTWLPTQLYAKAAYRAVRQMVALLKAAAEGGDAIATQQTKQTAHAQRTAKEVSAAGTTMATQAVAASRQPNSVKAPVPAGAGNPTAKSQGTVTALSPQPSAIGVVPVRPKHIDQYVHLLPVKTQERAAKVRELLRNLDAAREKMRLLMDDPQASDASREQWAKTATRIDGEVKSIYKELDSEWDKLVKSGRVGVDAFGNAYVNPTTSLPKGEGDAASQEKKRELTDEQKKRVDALKKFLRDRRLPEGEKRREAYAQKFREYHDELVRDYGAVYFTDTMRENAKALGLDFGENTTTDSTDKTDDETTTQND